MVRILLKIKPEFAHAGYMREELSLKFFKKTALLLCVALLLCSSAYAALDIFTVPAYQPDTLGTRTCSMSVAKQEILEISARDLELRMELRQNELRGITITAIPDLTQGAFYLDGVEVEAGEALNREELDRLCFVPNESAAVASLGFVPQSTTNLPSSLIIHITPHKNSAPEIENASYSTVKNVGISGSVAATDPDGDALTLLVAQKPQKGQVTFDGGAFLYTPYKDMTGSDFFTVCAVDTCYNYSREAVLSVSIENNKTAFQYADMSGSFSEYAAIKLYEKNVLQGEKIGQSWFFHPDETVTRGEFLVMLLGVSGMDAQLSPTVNTGLANDAQLPLWLKPYVKKAVVEGIIPAGNAFVYSEIPTRAEAVLLCSNAAKIDDVKEYSLQISDKEKIPSWALQSYKELAAYRMLDLHDGNAYPTGSLTKSYSADLLWQLWKHCER